MSVTVDDVKTKLKELIYRGHALICSFVLEESDDEQRKRLMRLYEEYHFTPSELVNFNSNYEIWYSEALIAIKLFVPNRLNDFVQLYKNDKRKNIDSTSYTISDAIVGVTLSRNSIIIADRATALPKITQQVSILESAEKITESVLYGIQFSIRADLFDSELDAANELLKAGFLRATGAMCGVILEKHLAQVCSQHDISIRKKSPAINDYNEALKNAGAIDLPTWRHIQLLGDLRNLCCHDKKTEPTKDQANDLLTGTTKIIKTLN